MSDKRHFTCAHILFSSGLHMFGLALPTQHVYFLVIICNVIPKSLNACFQLCQLLQGLDELTEEEWVELRFYVYRLRFFQFIYVFQTFLYHCRKAVFSQSRG